MSTSTKPIQTQFGQEVIGAFARFARADLKSPDGLAADEFSHVQDPVLRQRLADVHYGSRWIYKLGLALLTTDAERAAHIRGQVIDYASICESLLQWCIAESIHRGLTIGDGYQFQDPHKQAKAIKWKSANPMPTVRRQSFWWAIVVAEEFGIISPKVSADLDLLRKRRNTVHLSEIGEKAYLNQSKESFNTMNQTIRQTKKWVAKNA